MSKTFHVKSPLAREIAFMLVVKTVALGAIWFAFFSHPVVPSMSTGMDPTKVGEAVAYRPAAVQQ